MRTTIAKSWFLPLLLLALFLWLGVAMFQGAPPVRQARTIDIAPDEKDIVLGWRELGQRKGPRSAEADHLLLRHGDAGWEMFNIARTRKVDVRTDMHPTLFLKRWPLAAGDTIFIGDVAVEVTRCDTETLALKQANADRSVRWADGQLAAGPDESVYDAHWSFWRRLKHRMAPRLAKWSPFETNRERFLFSLGGGITCPDRWRIDGVWPGAARIYQYQGRFFLGPGVTDTPVHMARAGEKPCRFSQMGLPLSGETGRVERLIMGRTHYRVAADKDRLTLTPVAGVDLWRSETPPPEPRTPAVTVRYDPDPRRSGQGLPFHRWFLKHIRALVVAFVPGLLILIWVWRQRRLVSREFGGMPLAAISGALVPLVLGVPFILIQWRTRSDIDLSFILAETWLSWAWATVFWMRRRPAADELENIWSAALFLAGSGALVLTQLALGAENTRWFDFARKHALILALFGWAMPAFTLIPSDAVARAWKGFCTGSSAGWRWLFRRLPLAGCLALLFCQLGFGSEQGLWDLLQPAELSKILLAITAAFVGMDLSELRNMNSSALKAHPAPLVWGFLKTLFLVALAVMTVLIGVRDISPLLILAVFFMAWVWAVAPHPWEKGLSSVWILRGAVFAALLAAVAAGWLAYTRPTLLPEDMPQRDRFLVWADPANHPHSGEQALKALRYAGRGGWTGGMPSAFGDNGGVMSLPMVQNDFIGSFVLFKFGALPGLILMLVQAAYIRALFSAGGAAKRWGAARRSFDQRRAGTILYMALWGLAWMQAAHWSIAWANALGLLPVMGQPMTWISAANSHLIFFALPTLVLAMTAARLGHR